MSETEPKPLNLPIEITTLVDAARVARELAALDEFMSQSGIRKPGASLTLPRLSRPLEKLAADNALNLLLHDDRKKLGQALHSLRTVAPRVHISFSTEPSAAFTQSITEWFRREVHPYMLLRIGLQPGIGAGCIVRTDNRQFDLSLREHYANKKPLLLEKIRGGTP